MIIVHVVQYLDSWTSICIHTQSNTCCFDGRGIIIGLRREQWPPRLSTFPMDPIGCQYIQTVAMVLKLHVRAFAIRGSIVQLPIDS